MNVEYFENNIHSQESLLKYGRMLYNENRNSELEDLFGRCLRKSYDVEFWKIYIDYVLNAVDKKVNISDVYAFVLNHFEHSYYRYEFIQEYIGSLASYDDNSLVVNKIRKIYHKAFRTPFEHIGKLWIEYEKWEVSVNRSGSKQMIEQMQPVYLQSSTTYKRLASFLAENNYFRVLDVELENPCRLTNTGHTARIGFLFNYFLGKEPWSEALWILKSIYLPDEKDIERLQFNCNENMNANISSNSNVKSDDNRSVEHKQIVNDNERFSGNVNGNLRIWYSFIYKKNLFDFTDPCYKEIMTINYFVWVVKNEGMDIFRKKFREMKADAGVYGYVFAGHVEYHQGNNKMLAYEIFQEGFTKFPDSSLLCEEYFDLFLFSGDDDNIRALFKKLRKTEKMWDKMIRYEFANGNIDRYKELLLERSTLSSSSPNNILKPVTNIVEHDCKEGTEQVYVNIVKNLKYYNFKIEVDEIISIFLKKLPVVLPEDNFLATINTSAIIDLLKNASF